MTIAEGMLGLSGFGVTCSFVGESTCVHYISNPHGVDFGFLRLDNDIPVLDTYPPVPSGRFRIRTCLSMPQMLKEVNSLRGDPHVA
jgi:hypothetical protein